MHTDPDTLFARLWESYRQVTPSAYRIHKILGAEEGQAIVNDHIALRTFNLDPVRLDTLAEHFLSLGYKEGGEYHFEAKKLYARHYEHPSRELPKVFISELLVEQCSTELQSVVQHLVEQVKPEAVKTDDFLYSGRHWEVAYETYRELMKESEYAAWMAAWGYRANHFTVSINHLEQFRSVPAIVHHGRSGAGCLFRPDRDHTQLFLRVCPPLSEAGWPALLGFRGGIGRQDL
jgi:hypothetical protein